MLSAYSSTADKLKVVGAALVVCSQDPVITLSSLFVWEKKKILQHRTKFEGY